MAFRGRGRGRGRGGGFGFDRPPKFVPYENFPEVEKLPNLQDILYSSNAATKEASKEMAFRKSQLEEFWRGSCYHLQEDAFSTKTESGSIVGKRQKTQERREGLQSYLTLTPSNFPVELIQGSRRVQQSNKKLKWDRHADQLFDTFEKLEEKYKDKDEGEKKQDEDEEEELNEEAEEESSDDDYNQNIDFDDDEDDMNMEEEPEEDILD